MDNLTEICLQAVPPVYYFLLSQCLIVSLTETSLTFCTRNNRIWKWDEEGRGALVNIQGANAYLHWSVIMVIVVHIVSWL
jgi:hypothetical protein